MAAQTPFLPFATGAGSNVITDAAYNPLAARLTGFQAGTAISAQLNKVWRQSSVVASMIAQFTADNQAGVVNDDGNVALLEAQFEAALTGYLTGGGLGSGGLVHYGLDTGATGSTVVVASITPPLPPGGLAAGQIFALILGNTLNTGATCNIAGSGVKSIVGADGVTGTVGGYLKNSVFLLLYNGTAYQTITPPALIAAIAPLTLYVATTGSDTANTGLTAGSPFLTISHAYAFAQANYNMNNLSLTIKVADGTYTAPALFNGSVTNCPVTYLTGNTSNAANCLINVTNNIGIGANSGAFIIVRGFKVMASGTSAGQGLAIYANTNSQIALQAPLEVGTCGIAHLSCSYGGLIDRGGIYGGLTISGSAQMHIECIDGGIVTVPDNTAYTHSVTNTPNFSSAFVVCSVLGQVFDEPQGSYSGAATGPRYLANLNSVIDTGSNNQNYYPGSVAGSLSTGGQYI